MSFGSCKQVIDGVVCEWGKKFKERRVNVHDEGDQEHSRFIISELSDQFPEI